MTGYATSFSDPVKSDRAAVRDPIGFRLQGGNPVIAGKIQMNHRFFQLYYLQLTPLGWGCTLVGLAAIESKPEMGDNICTPGFMHLVVGLNFSKR